MQYDSQVRAVLDATRGSRDWNQARIRSPFPMDVSTDYTLNCLSDDRHAGSDADFACGGWLAPLNYVGQECRCACHESAPRPSYAEALRRVRERM